MSAHVLARTLDRAPDALLADGAVGAEVLGEEADA